MSITVPPIPSFSSVVYLGMWDYVLNGGALGKGPMDLITSSLHRITSLLSLWDLGQCPVYVD